MKTRQSLNKKSTFLTSLKRKASNISEARRALRASFKRAPNSSKMHVHSSQAGQVYRTGKYIKGGFGRNGRMD